jgi:hypothetical protein
VQSITQARALRDPHFCQAAVLAALIAEKPLARYGTLALDGADEGRSRLCYRLSVTDPDSEQLFVWLSVFGDDGRRLVQLQKSGVGIDDDEPIPAVIYEGWQEHDGLLVPHKRTLVLGLDERPELTCVNQAVAVGKLDDAVFQVPPQPTK